LAKTIDGLYITVEPIAVLPVGNTQGFSQVLHDMMLRGNPTIPRVDFRTYNEPGLLEATGLKSWTTFYRGNNVWSVDESDGIYSICVNRREKHGGWVDDLSQKITFPSGTSLDEVCARIVEIVQAKAKELGKAKKT